MKTRRLLQRKPGTKDSRDKETETQERLVACLLNVPATCECISWTDTRRESTMATRTENSCDRETETQELRAQLH